MRYPVVSPAHSLPKNCSKSPLLSSNQILPHQDKSPRVAPHPPPPAPELHGEEVHHSVSGALIFPLPPERLRHGLPSEVHPEAEILRFSIRGTWLDIIKKYPFPSALSQHEINGFSQTKQIAGSAGADTPWSRLRQAVRSRVLSGLRYLLVMERGRVSTQ